MATKYWFEDRDGNIYKRTSANRVYSHAVLVKYKARETDEGYLRAHPAYMGRPEYRRTEALAQACASQYRNRPDVEWVDVYPVCDGPLLLAQLFPALG